MYCTLQEWNFALLKAGELNEDIDSTDRQVMLDKMSKTITPDRQQELMDAYNTHKLKVKIN